MPPTVILIRHAQAEHNATKDYSIPDPPLTPLGRTQCHTLHSILKTHSLYPKISLIVTSPMTRTLETTLLTLSPLLPSTPIILSALFQENSSKPCDTGTPIPLLLKKYPQFNYDSVDPSYPTKTGIYSFSKDAITERGKAARKWLREREEEVVVVVSHSGFLRVGLSNCWYENADFRVFGWGERGELVEWQETREGERALSGGMGRSCRGFAGWETQGFPEDEKVGGEEVVVERPGV